MFRTKKGKTFFKDKVKKLMRLEKNVKLKSLIENEETNPNFRDSTGTTLLHMAARYGNLEMMNYSLVLGCEMGAKDASGNTPLIVAVKYNVLSIIRRLLCSSMDMLVILTTNLAGEYPLQLMFDHDETEHRSMFQLCWSFVKSGCKSAEEAVEILLKAGCSLVHAAIAKDAETTRIFLGKMQEIDSATCRKNVLYEMLYVDPANPRVLLSHDRLRPEKITDFLWILQLVTNTRDFPALRHLRFSGPIEFLDAMRVYATRIVDWNLLTRDNVEYLYWIFEHAEKDVLRIFLESNIVSHAQSHLGHNLLPRVYANPNAGVIKLLQDMGLDVEARDLPLPKGETALHLAVRRGVASSVKFLLDAGVDPNITFGPGEVTPMLYVRSAGPLTNQIECVDLLLRYNANVEVVCNRGYCIFEFLFGHINENHLALEDRVLAHLAMLEATGSPMKRSTMDYINRTAGFRIRYEASQRQVNEMKERKIADSLSFMTVLTGKPENIAPFVGAQREKIIIMLDSLNEFNGYYTKRLRDQVDLALKVNELRAEMAYLIVECITSFRGHDSVVDEIISYFTLKELLVFE